MTYPVSHLYLTIHWSPTASSLETGQCGIRFDSATPPTQALVDGCASAVQSFWTTAANLVPIGYNLRFLRLAGIANDGRYALGTLAYDHTYGAGISGGASTDTFPLQTASVTTLTTAQPRGQAHQGRIYLPPIQSALDPTKVWSSTNTQARAQGVVTMITSLNAALPGRATIFSKGTIHSAVGAKQLVTGVKVGSRPDVQRRRAKQVVEVYTPTYNVV